MVPHVFLTALSVEDKFFFITNLVLQEVSGGLKSPE